jgi:hypothetical protein
MRQRWLEVATEIRADAGFAVPALYDYCEREGITYTMAPIINERLKKMGKDLLEEAPEEVLRTTLSADGGAIGRLERGEAAPKLGSTWESSAEHSFTDTLTTSHRP